MRWSRRLEAQLEREYGPECLESMLFASSGFKIPVPIMGVGAALMDGAIVPREVPSISSLVRKNMLRLRGERGGFASFSDLVSEATVGGKRQDLMYNKTGVTAPAASASQPLWAQGALPGAGSNASAAPGGSTTDNTTVGGFQQADAGGGDTLHLCSWTGVSTVAGSLMLYDYLFGVNVSEGTAGNAVSGTQGRYAGTAGSHDYAAGVFITGRVTTVRAANSNTVTITYIDQDGNTAEAGAAVAMRSSAAVQTIPFTAPVWSYALNSADRGARNITDVTYSGTSSGVIDWFLGRPLAILPQPVANVGFLLDGINSAFNLVRIQTDACLALMEFYKSATTAATVSGHIVLVSG